jgi:Transposase DDE domain group 1
MKAEKTRATSIHKVRRRALGNKRALGHELQRRGRRVRRSDPECIRPGPADESLSGVGGLVPFGVYLRRLGIDRSLQLMFDGLKTGRGVVYPMAGQIRLLLDANVVGEERVFGLEALGADPLFVKLAGGSVPSLDTVYRDLCRMDEMALAKLELLMAHHGLEDVRSRKLGVAHLDIDTTVEPLFGTQQGALPGPNPRYPGRPSYHPLLAVVAESQTCVGAVLRPGDRGFGGDDAASVRAYLDRVRAATGSDCRLVVRIDAAGDCTEIMETVESSSSYFIVKARLTQDLIGALFRTTQWRTVEHDALGRATRQVAEVHFQREEWKHRGLAVRVVAVRTLERDVGKQVQLWPDSDYAVQTYLTNDFHNAPEDVASEYNGRAEVEPIIGELKHALGIGKVPSQSFNANHAAFLIKLLAHNLVRRYARAVLPSTTRWRMPWLRRALFVIPARLLRSGRCWTLRFPPKSALFDAFAYIE